MVICIDRFLSDQRLSGYGLLTEDLMEELARRNSMHRFVWLTGFPHTAEAGLASNITIYPVNSWVLRWLGKKWWCRISLPRLLKKLQADKYLSAGSLCIPALFPTYLFLPAVPVVKGGRTNNRQTANRLRAASRHAKKIFVFSDHDRQRLREYYPVATGTTVYLKPAAIHPTGPLTAEEREAAKNNFSGGLEYFAFAGDLQEAHLLTPLLKAFSQFKKWQRSNMQLVIAGSITTGTDAWLQTIDSYKYRKDVHIIRNPSKAVLLAVIAGAYAFVYPARHDHVPVNILYAFHAGVPVLASRIPVVEEVAGEAAVYAPGNDEHGFAAGMKTLYKDERLRDSMIRQGSLHVKGDTSDMVQECWQILETGSNRESA